MKKWLLNPFVYVAGSRALAIGLVALALTAFVASLGNTHFDGVLDVHIGRPTLTVYYFIEQLIDWLCLVVILLVAGKIFSKSSVRVIDIAGTIAFARWPMIFCAIVQLIVRMPPLMSPHDIEAAIQLSAPLIILGLCTLLAVIWMVALTYHAFSVSCNIKGSQCALIFTVSLIISELVSKLFFINL